MPSAAVLLILASQRIESVIGDWFGDEDQRQHPPGPIDVSTKRGAPPSIVECFILAWVCGQ
jgi:transient receptor potential cation channel subfamily C